MNDDPKTDQQHSSNPSSKPLSGIEQELLNEVLENPLDDTPRLVFADYWDENGNSRRAEFVRSHITMHRCTERNDFDSDEYTNAVKSLIHFESSEFIEWMVFDGLSELTETKLFALSFNEDLVQIRNVEKENNIFWDRGFVTKIELHSYEQLLKNWPVISRWPIDALVLLAEGRIYRFKKRKAWVASYFSLDQELNQIEDHKKWPSRSEMIAGFINFADKHR
jgi:uncharacterized protein (TIGR02996 family)